MTQGCTQKERVNLLKFANVKLTGDHQDEEETEYGQGGHDAQEDGRRRRRRGDAEGEREAQEEPGSVPPVGESGRRRRGHSIGEEAEGGGQGGQDVNPWR